MPFPKKIKPNIQLSPQKTLFSRREQLLEYINKDGTYLPKSVLHADLDRGMLDYVKNELKLVVNGKTVPLIDIIISTQNWSQYLETWRFVDLDYNPSPPYITVVRTPEVKYGSNPALMYTIPNRRQFYYASVPTWNGNMQGMDIYTIPQPVPVDINYQVKIVCNRMRELNSFNKLILQKFSSRQSYSFIKGQYVPIVLDSIEGDSQLTMESRKYYVQSYNFTMLGYLIDEDEFEVKPAVARVMTLMEIEEPLKKLPKIENTNPRDFDLKFTYVVGNNTLTDFSDNKISAKFEYSTNVASYEVYINGDYYGSDVNQVLLNTNDIFRVDIVKVDNSKESIIKFINRLD